MTWELMKYRMRRRARDLVLAASSYIHSAEEEEDPEGNLDRYLRERRRQRGSEGAYR